MNKISSSIMLVVFFLNSNVFAIDKHKCVLLKNGHICHGDNIQTLDENNFFSDQGMDLFSEKGVGPPNCGNTFLIHRDYIAEQNEALGRLKFFYRKSTGFIYSISYKAPIFKNSVEAYNYIFDTYGNIFDEIYTDVPGTMPYNKNSQIGVYVYSDGYSVVNRTVRDQKLSFEIQEKDCIKIKNVE